MFDLVFCNLSFDRFRILQNTLTIILFLFQYLGSEGNLQGLTPSDILINVHPPDMVLNGCLEDGDSSKVARNNILFQQNEF